VLDEILVERPPKNGPAPVKFDRAAYWYDLREHEDERRSEASAYAKLTADAREDVILLEPFFAIAARVADMDRRRETVLAQATSSNPDERVHSRKRITRTPPSSAGSAVRSASAWRAQLYALERLVVHAPLPLAAECERALTLLHTRIGQYCRGGPQSVVTMKG